MIKEIKKWFNLIHNDYDFDYGFLIDIIEFKLEKMKEYFSTHSIVVEERKYSKQIQVALNILRAGYKTNIILDSDLGDIYVNINNVNRYFNNKELKFLGKYNLEKYYRATIRERKAKYLFWKYLYYHIENWWD